MARITQDDFQGQSDAQSQDNKIEIDATGMTKIEVPNADFIANSDISKEGQDLVLETPNGETLVIQNYFNNEDSPLLESPDGSVLTGNLVNSFLNSGAEYAQLNSMSDVSPIGAIEEMNGDATVTRVDGTTEPLTLGSPIFQGDVVETSEAGAVNILFIDETSMAVSESAKISIDNYQFDAATESGETNLSVLRGVFVYTSGLIGRDDPDDVLIDTPVGSIGIRGTIIAGKIKPGEESEITVLEGAIVVKNGLGETTLSEQYEGVKLTGFNTDMQDLGVQNAADVGKTYGSVSDVIPKLFSSINDNIKENAANEDKAEDATEEPVEAVEESTEPEIQAEAEEVAPEPIAQEPTIESPMTNKAPMSAMEKAEAIKEAKILDKIQNKKSLNVRANADENDTDQINPNLLEEKDPANFNPAVANFHLNILNTSSPYVQNIGTVSAVTSIGDINADGVADYVDIVTGSAVKIMNGSTSSLLHSPLTALGVQDESVSAIGDFNNDGYDDFVYGSPGTSSGKFSLVEGGNTLTISHESGASSFDNLGVAVAGIGDFDGDGKLDYVVGATGTDRAHVNNGSVYFEFGNGNSTEVAGHINSMELGSQIAGLGDINGDGYSDVIINTNQEVGGHYEAYILQGTSSTLPTDTNGVTKISTPYEIVSGGTAGDFNGDGFDDIAVSLKMGANINTFLIFGGNSLPSTIDLNYLKNPDNAYEINHPGAASASEYNVSSIGDTNGDGFDDVQVGVVGGDQFVVSGHIVGNNIAYVTDNSASDGNGDTGKISSTVNDQSMVGDSHFIDDGHTNLSMRGGDDRNDFSLKSANFRTIDGGAGNDDTIRFGEIGQTLDFTNINYEQIDQIEQIHISKDNATVKLTVENIFNLLKTSDDGSLTIELGSSGGTAATTGSLIIDAPTNQADNPTGVVAALNEFGSGATYEGVDGDGNHHYEIGSYDLYIDADLTTTVV